MSPIQTKGKMNISELKSELDAKGIKYNSRMRKAELEALLNTANEEVDHSYMSDDGFRFAMSNGDRVRNMDKTRNRREKSIEFCKEHGLKETPRLNSKMRKRYLRTGVY